MSEKRAFRDGLYEQFARIGKSLASPKRLELLDVLSQGPRTVEGLAGLIDCSIANTSRHLQVLRQARLVESDKRGLYVYYRLSDAAVSHLMVSLHRLAEKRFSELTPARERMAHMRSEAWRRNRQRFVHGVVRGEFVLLDVRSRDEFSAGHLPGAISIPLRELDQRFVELPRDRQVVAYCRGPYCLSALEAVDLLINQGLDVRHLGAGIAEWRAEGGQVVIIEGSGP
ncbi:MAG: ArsR family transcriptional regulator [Myxococcales bacterium]|nr:ArsR family transcriptional regulator [Myxococcales bacterium]